MEIVLLITALVIGSVSLAMTLMRNRIEERIAASAANQNAPASQENITVMNILAAGSADYGTYAIEQSDYTGNFNALMQIVPVYDLAVYSQKSMIGTELPPVFADALVGCGFDLVGLANPNAMRNGKAGIESSMSYWSGSTAQTAGTYISTDSENKLVTAQVGSISCAFLSFTASIQDEISDQQAYLVNVYNDKTSPQIVEKARESTDVVIVTMFWDGADGEAANDRQKEIARELADAGASVIIGNADHAIQPVAWIDDTLVYYSMGDLISDSQTDQERLGVLGAVTITKTVSANSTRVELTNPRVDLIASTGNAGNGYYVKMMSDMSDNDFSSAAAVYEKYKVILQMMDDSIRIGGIR